MNAAMTPRQRKERARKAVAERWRRYREERKEEVRDASIRFGYPRGTPLKPKEVADQFGITRDMVKKIQSTALETAR